MFVILLKNSLEGSYTHGEKWIVCEIVVLVFAVQCFLRVQMRVFRGWFTLLTLICRYHEHPCLN